MRNEKELKMIDEIEIPESEFEDNSKKIIDSLVEDFSENRTSLYGMVDQLADIRSHVEDILPKKLDYRNKFAFEEKIKTLSELFHTELSVRKQIDDSLKTEIGFRTKLDIDEKGEVDNATIEELARKMNAAMIVSQNKNNERDVA